MLRKIDTAVACSGLFLLIILTMINIAHADQEYSNDPRIGCIKAPLRDGCGSSIVAAGKKTAKICILFEESEGFLMNINGKDVKITKVNEKSNTRRKKQNTKGDRYISEYKYDDITIIIDDVKTSVGYESVEGKATITIQKGSGKKQIIKGDSQTGC